MSVRRALESVYAVVENVKTEMRKNSRKMLNIIFRSFIISLLVLMTKTLNVLTLFRRDSAELRRKWPNAAL